MPRDIEEIKFYLIKFSSQFHKNFSSFFRRSSHDKYNCNKNQIRAITIIGRNKSIIPTDLGKCINMEKGSLTTLLNSLEDMGLVKRENDPLDKRKVIVQLSKEGEGYYRKIEEKVLSQIQEVLKPLTEEEIQILRESLKNVVSILDKVGEKNG